MKKKIVIIGILALFAVFAIPTASAQGYYYLVPADSNATYGNCAEVGLRAHSAIYIASGKIKLTYDPSCAVISCANWTRNTTLWESGTCSIPTPGVLVITYAAAAGVEYPPGDYHIGNLTICCNSTTYCKTDFEYITSETYHSNVSGSWEVPLLNATFTCGAPTEETFSKDLYEGWNLISLPLSPSDNRTSAVLASVWENVSAVYRFNATSKQFESVMDRTMELGEGYFVYVTQNCTWTYSGTPYTSISIELKKGLNMVGWLNCSEDITDALSSIAGNYWYVARWNAIGQKFEVYNPVAPPVFNDFNTMERGEGYFISMKSDGTLTESC